MPALITAAVFSFFACKKPYEPPEIKGSMNLLVVDGTISAGNDAVSTFILSRTKRLNDSVLFEPERNASVYIEEEQGGSFLMEPKGDGVYHSQPLSLPAGRNYRIRIITAGKEYLSSYVPAKTSPAIDSLTWKQDKDVTVSVHTHDPSNNTRYYRWEYVETWNYRSVLHAMWGVKDGMIFLKDSITQTDSCWRTANSTNIVVGSSVALSEDVISYLPVTIIPQHAEKISMGYSILVKQYGLTEQAFRYFKLIQKNTQQLGTLFDAQPSQLTGNIQCVDSPNEPVIGFVTASTVSEKRTSIRNSDLVDWHFMESAGSCHSFFEVAVNPVDYRIYSYPDPTFAPYYFISMGPLVVAPKACLECTERGGTNVKPSFW
jgi:hypothetical protein